MTKSEIRKMIVNAFLDGYVNAKGNRLTSSTLRKAESYAFEAIPKKMKKVPRVVYGPDGLQYKLSDPGYRILLRWNFHDNWWDVVVFDWSTPLELFKMYIELRENPTEEIEVGE